jgi:hypothetical protein
VALSVPNIADTADTPSSTAGHSALEMPANSAAVGRRSQKANLCSNHGITCQRARAREDIQKNTWLDRLLASHVMLIPGPRLDLAKPLHDHALADAPIM